MELSTQLIDFACGVIGFSGFEALRLYKLNIGPKKKKGYHSSIYYHLWLIILLAIFSGVVALAFKSGHLLKSIFIGFSIPSCGKSFFGNERINGPAIDNQVDVEDLSFKVINYRQYVLLKIKKYFTF